MSNDESAGLGTVGAPPRDGRSAGGDEAESAITVLYQAHALGLTRLAYVMLGDRASAEDVVQEAFYGLYRNWPKLAGPAGALPYLRTCVLNGCRSAGRRRGLGARRTLHERAAASAESVVLASEEQRSVLPAIRRLPARQREVLIMRFYLHQTDAEIARVMAISPSTVRSSTHRALAALGRMLGEIS